MAKIILLVGAPGSGKSTWAKEYVADPANNAVRISNDDLRAMCNTVLYDWRNEGLLEKFLRSMVEIALDAGWDVVLDNLNISQKHYNKWQDYADLHGYNFEVRVFDPGLDTCVERDKLRERSIGEKRIREIYAQFERNWK